MRFCSVCIGTQFARFRATSCVIFFFFNDTATTEIYTLSLHDALPIYPRPAQGAVRLRRCRGRPGAGALRDPPRAGGARDHPRQAPLPRTGAAVNVRTRTGGSWLLLGLMAAGAGCGKGQADPRAAGEIGRAHV